MRYPESWSYIIPGFLGASFCLRLTLKSVDFEWSRLLFIIQGGLILSIEGQIRTKRPTLPWGGENSPADRLWISSAVLTLPDWWPLNFNISSPCVSCTTGSRFYQSSYSCEPISYNKYLSLYTHTHTHTLVLPTVFFKAAKEFYPVHLRLGYTENPHMAKPAIPLITVLAGNPLTEPRW